MANQYYERLSEMNPGELADGLAMEAEFDAISRAFDMLPVPHTGGQGFGEPVRVSDAVNPDEAVSLGQLNAAIGEAKLLPIATYGNLNAAAWGTLASMDYLLFGTGAQFSNFPATLVAGSTYFVHVRHVVGGAGASLYCDKLTFASVDDASNVDINREFSRIGSTLAAANTAGWKSFALKKGGLTPLEALPPAADRLAYYTGAATAALAVLTPFARTLLDDADAAAARGTLGALGSNPTVITGQDWNAITTQGIYMVAMEGASPVNAPALYGYGQLRVQVVGQTIMQEYFPHQQTGAPPPKTRANCAVRMSYDSGAVWQPWGYVYDNRTILGIVAQSGGVPIGSIFEHGSNANGEYVKFADGTLICMTPQKVVPAITTPVGSLFTTVTDLGPYNWPVAFVGNVRGFTCCTSDGISSTPVISSIYLGSTVLTYLRVCAPATIDPIPPSFTAAGVGIGRWF